MVRSLQVAPKLALAFLTLAELGHVANAGTLRKIWDFHAGVVPGVEVRGARLSVFSLRFSRDGQRIAVIIGRSLREQTLFILDARNPDAHYARLAVNLKVGEQEPWSGSAVEWSPSGRQVKLAETIVQLSDGSACTLPGRGQFVGPTQVVAYQPKPQRFSFFDLECNAVHVWEPLPEGQHVDYYAASAERGLIFITQNTISRSELTEVAQLVIDVNSGNVLRRLPGWQRSTAVIGVYSTLAKAQFADAGRALCGLRGDTWHRSIECSAVETGQMLGVTKGWSHPNIRTAVGASRVVISDYTRKLDWIDFLWYPGSLRKRVVWDFRSGKELVRWKPKTQEVSAYAVVPGTQPYRFDISPDGDYIVEGGAGVVSLYKIEP